MYIFFDCDGVINQLQPNFYIDENCVYRLAQLAISLGARLIMVSTWSAGFVYSLEMCTPQVRELRKLLRYERMDICGVIRESESRYKDIKTFLGKNLDSYLILDDDKSLYKDVIDDNLYFVNAKTGLTEKDVKQLTKKYYKRYK